MRHIETLDTIITLALKVMIIYTLIAICRNDYQERKNKKIKSRVKETLDYLDKYNRN